MGDRGIVVFYAIHDLFILERELRKFGVDVKTVPVPKEVSADCGTSIQFDVQEIDSVRAVIDGLGLNVQGVHEL